MKKPNKVALRPRWWRRVKNEWSVRARKKARRGARSRARGSYWDKNEFAEALKLIRNDFKEEESIANDERMNERKKEGYVWYCLWYDIIVYWEFKEIMMSMYVIDNFEVLLLFFCLFIYILFVACKLCTSISAKVEMCCCGWRVEQFWASFLVVFRIFNSYYSSNWMDVYPPGSEV